ncbi:MAG: amidohydrolase [Lachnospiraceae bacterium]|nr:amidohydrolase [Lachnospiraceae bacterium]
MEAEAKTIFYNGIVYTGQEAPAQAFLVKEGLFAAVGRDGELLPLADETTRLVDLQGRFVCPGFNDSHMHLLNLGQSLVTAQLAPHTGSLAELLRYLKEYTAQHPLREGRWLTGRGWNQDYFRDVSRMPDRKDLDTVSTEYPIRIIRACGHCCVVNSRALELAGITAATPSPEGGHIGRENGEPDGRLYDNAMDLLSPFLPLPDREELKEMIRLACRTLNSYGITSVQSDDYCVFRGIAYEAVNAAFRELEAGGELSVRVCEQANFTELKDLRRFIEAGCITGAGSTLFRIGPLKMLGDGSLGSRTAHLSRPYADQPDTCGFSLFTAELMNELIRNANEKGMQVAVHAIGDACLDQVLDAIELALQEHPRKDHRHGIIHCQISRPDQLKRIRDLGLHVYAQSIFLDYDNHIVEKRVGKELAASSYAWKTLIKSGVSVSNGSDCPVEMPDVMRGIECAVTRCSIDGTGPYLPQEAFSVKEALDSFTVRGAEASFEEEIKGRIAPGCLADFTVLERDPFAVPSKELHTIPVRAAYLGRPQSSVDYELTPEQFRDYSTPTKKIREES